MNDKKLVTVMSGGIIKELGGIGGPIMTPSRIAIDKVRRMVIAGRKIYEHNPANPDEKILLTEDNVMTDNFSSNSAPVNPAPAPQPTPAPAAPAEPVAPVEDPAPVNDDESDDPIEEEVDTDPADPNGGVQDSATKQTKKKRK